MILRERPLPSVKLAGSLAWFITLLASSANGADEELPYESSLLPPVTTYVDLLLCANTSQRYRNNDADAERYRQAAFEVQDMTEVRLMPVHEHRLTRLLFFHNANDPFVHAATHECIHFTLVAGLVEAEHKFIELELA